VLDLDLLDPYPYRRGMPHELYAELHEVARVLWHPRTHVPAIGTDIEFWAVIGHKEVEQANRDWETFSPTTRVVPARASGIMFVTKDPPEYNRIRRHISAGFTPRMVGRLEDQMRARNERILDDAAARGDFDFVPEIAYQLPMHVIADIVGFPEADRPEVFRLTDLIVRATYASNPRRRESCPISPYPLRFPRDRSAHSGERATRLSDHGSLIARTL
jgi:cytochrome P450